MALDIHNYVTHTQPWDATDRRLYTSRSMFDVSGALFAVGLHHKVPALVAFYTAREPFTARVVTWARSAHSDFCYDISKAIDRSELDGWLMCDFEGMYMVTDDLPKALVNLTSLDETGHLLKAASFPDKAEGTCK